MALRHAILPPVIPRPILHAMASMRLALMSLTMFIGCASRSLKTDSITESSVDVVSSPQKAAQSLTTIPAPITSLSGEYGVY